MMLRNNMIDEFEMTENGAMCLLGTYAVLFGAVVIYALSGC